MTKNTLFKQINSLFSHVYVVTIARAAYRHPALIKNLEGLQYELFYGLDIKDTSVEDFRATGIYSKEMAQKNHRYSKPIEGGMLGCSISHRLVYEDMLLKKYPTVLILEDDVFVNEKAAAEFMQAFKELPAQWELLYLDYNKNEKKPFLGIVKQAAYHIQSWVGALKFSNKMIRHLYAKKYSKHLLLAGYHDFTDAYAITATAAQKLLNLQTPVQWFPDHLLAYACTNKIVNAYCVANKIFSQSSPTSDTSGSLTGTS